jgi:hypothetical protein
VQEVSDDDSDASAAQKVMHGLDCGPLRPVVVDSGEGVVGDKSQEQQAAQEQQPTASRDCAHARTSHAPSICQGDSPEHFSGEVPRDNKAQAGRQPSTAKEVERPAQESDLQSQSPVGRRGRRRQGQPSVQKALPPRLVGNTAGSAEPIGNKEPERGNKEPERAAKLGDQPMPDPLAALDGAGALPKNWGRRNQMRRVPNRPAGDL